MRWSDDGQTIGASTDEESVSWIKCKEKNRIESMDTGDYSRSLTRQTFTAPQRDVQIASDGAMFSNFKSIHCKNTF